MPARKRQLNYINYYCISIGDHEAFPSMFKFFSQALMRSRNLRENGKYLPEEVCDTKVHIWVFCSIDIIYSRTYNFVHPHK